MAQIPLKSIKFPGLPDTYTVDPGLSEEAKAALLACFQHVAWIDEHGQDYYDDLHDALYPATGLVSISAVFTQGSAVINEGDDLNTLKQYLVVTGYYSDGVSQVITDYALSGQLTEGTSTITVSKEGKTATFTVTVSGSYWDYEWDASSGIVPVDKDGNAWQGSFVNGLFKLDVVNDELQFARIGPIECEIEWMCPQLRDTYPYFSFCHTYGNNGGSGFKLYRNSESGYLRTTISGAGADTSITVPENTISKIKVICEANHCRADVDGNILEGNGAVNNQYLLANSIGYPTYNDVDFRIKSLKYKYL